MSTKVNRLATWTNHPKGFPMQLTEKTYPRAKAAVDNFPKVVAEQRKTLQDLGLTEEEIERAMAPMLSFMAGVKEDVEIYEKEVQLEMPG